MDKNIDLVSLPKKSFWKLSIPIVAFCVFDAIYGIVDMLWVSKISVEAFFAIGVSIPIVTLIYSCGDVVGQGTNSIMSRFIGSGDYESAYNALIHGMLLANLVWVVIVLCLLFAQGILFYLDKADSYILVFDYLIPIVVFAYIFIFVNLFSETLQAEGNSTTPTILIIGSNILNIILDPIFIFNFNLGIKGVAYATVLSKFLVFIAILYYYISGKSKVPLSLKYFKFRTYIFVEILKVTLPNFVDRGVWCFTASFINYILIMAIGAPGPILYSVCTKLKGLFSAPIIGNGMALMSITGHLFGAKKFDRLNEMFKYVLKVSLIVTLIVMIAFIVLRNYIFALFSITGIETEAWWIAMGGTIFMLALTFSITSSKMLDGFGKSIYSLLFTVIECTIQIAIIYVLFTINSHSNSVLIGIIASEIIIAVAYYVFLIHLFKNFKRKYEEKSTIKCFNKNNQNDESQDIDDKIDGIVENQARKLPSRAPLITALIAMIIIVLELISIPIKTQNYQILAAGIISLIISAISIYLMSHSNKAKIAVAGFITVSIILLLFMGRYGHLPAILLIISGILILYIRKIIKILRVL